MIQNYLRRQHRRLQYSLKIAILIVGLLNILIFIAMHWHQRLPTYASALGDNLSFERVTEPGFDADGQARLADSAWSMRYFQADGASTGYLYVGTDNNIVGLTLSALQRATTEEAPVKPPQIRRYRPDVSPTTWEVVFDYADVMSPPYPDHGFRTMAVYEARADGRTYLYAGTMAAHNYGPSIWRSATGERGSWENFFTFPNTPDNPIGSIRGMVAHEDGLLYLSTTPADDIRPGSQGQIWATDGLTLTPVITDGFGNPNNAAVSMLSSFNGCLYAGTYNPKSGYEVWKLRCLAKPTAPPQQVIQKGAGQPRNEAVMSMRPYQGHLFVGTGIPLGFNPRTRHGPRGCNVVRIDTQDQWDVVVGKRRTKPLSEYKAGFGWYLNAYCWYMQEHEGYLYLGTWDISRTIAFLGNHAENVAPRFKPLLDELIITPGKWGSPMGGDLYRTADGIHWDPVFLDGLGNPDNHGIRTLESTPDGFFIGTENPFSRLEIWRLQDM